MSERKMHGRGDHADHLKPRETLFTQMKVAGGPKDAKAVWTTRLSIGQFEDGERFMLRNN